MRRLLLLCLTLAACGDTYTQAAVGTGVAVAAVGLNRALTGGCWGQCRAGYLCNHGSGLCERGECAPPCATGSHCARARSGNLVCEPDPGTLRYGTATKHSPVPPPVDAGPPSDAEAGDAAPLPP